MADALRSPRLRVPLAHAALPLGATLLAFALHLPFVVRYDLHFQPDFAISVLMSRAILVEGDRPIFFWSQGYLGTYGNYVTALLFRLFGVSVPLAGLVSLAIWSTGVGLAAILARRLLGTRAAWWAALAAAIASPYANHYVTQPYSSYETAPVLAVLALGALALGERFAARPFGWRVAAEWTVAGILLGLGWWTTRLFLPSVVAVVLAAVSGASWRGAAVRRVVAGIACLVPAAIVGAAPQMLYQLRGAPATEPTPSLAIAPLAAIPANFAQAARTLPAYFNGDYRARLPEGVAFAEALAMDRDPQAGEEPPTSALDAIVCLAVAGILVATAYTAVEAWRHGRVALLACCLAPFVQLALIGMSAQTAGGYYQARRYWFASLLILPILFANAVVLGLGQPRAAVRWASGLVGALVLVWSVVAQARMLELPDGLADYRVLVRQLTESGERAVWMPTWNAWVVAALSGGEIDGVSRHYNRRPQIVDRVAAGNRLAVVLPAPADFPPTVRFGDTVLVSTGDRARSAGAWRWVTYARRPQPGWH